MSHYGELIHFQRRQLCQDWFCFLSEKGPLLVGGWGVGGWWGCRKGNLPLLCNKMYMNDPMFLDSYVKGPIFLTSWYMHIFFAQRFFEAACFGIQWIDYDICLTTSNKWVQKSKGSIWIGQHFRWSSIWMGPFFSKASYMNVVGFEIMARTPAPKLPQVKKELWYVVICSSINLPIRKSACGEWVSRDAQYMLELNGN